MKRKQLNMNTYTFTSKSRSYIVKRLDSLRASGWKVKAQHAHPDGGITTTLVR